MDRNRHAADSSDKQEMYFERPLAEDPLLSANCSNHEAYLIHIVGMLRLHSVEVDFAA